MLIKQSLMRFFLALSECRTTRFVAICKQKSVCLITNALQVADYAKKNGCRQNETAVLLSKRAQSRAQILAYLPMTLTVMVCC